MTPFYAYCDAVIGSELPRAEVVVALAIARKVGAEGYAWPPVVHKKQPAKGLAGLLGLPPRTILRAIKSLEDGGWLRVHRPSGSEKAKGQGNRYWPTIPGSEQVTQATPGSGEQVTQATASRCHADPKAGDVQVPEVPAAPLSCKEPGTQPLVKNPPNPPSTGADGWEPGETPADDDDGGGFSLEVCERIARESAEAHGRPMTGKAAKRAVAAIHAFVVGECGGYEAAATWCIIMSWACSPLWGKDLPGLGALANDPARFHEMRTHREDASPKGAPDHVVEIDQPGYTEAQRLHREERERKAREERERRELEEADRWRPRTRAEAEEAQRVTEEREKCFRALRGPAAAAVDEPAKWIVDREIRWLTAEWSSRWNRANPSEPWDSARATDYFERARVVLLNKHGADWQAAARRILDGLFQDGPRAHPDRLLVAARDSATEAA